MPIQGAINRLIGTAGAAVALSDKLTKDSGVDAKMADKARKVRTQKLDTIKSNREAFRKISKKALKEFDLVSRGGEQ